MMASQSTSEKAPMPFAALRKMTSIVPQVMAVTAASASATRQSALCSPPSTVTVAPLTHDAASEHRKTTTAATSSGRPMRPDGMPASVRA